MVFVGPYLKKHENVMKCFNHSIKASHKNGGVTCNSKVKGFINPRVKIKGL